jgi:hypothetical protein
VERHVTIFSAPSKPKSKVLNSEFMTKNFRNFGRKNSVLVRVHIEKVKRPCFKAHLETRCPVTATQAPDDASHISSSLHYFLSLDSHQRT